MRSLRYSECSSYNSFFWIFLTISRKASVKRLRNVRVGSDCSKCWYSVHLDGNTLPCGMLIFRQNGTASWHPRAQNCIFAIRPVKGDGTQLTLMRRMHADDFILGLNERIRDTQSKTPQNLWTTQKREREPLNFWTLNIACTPVIKINRNLFCIPLGLHYLCTFNWKLGFII